MCEGHDTGHSRSHRGREVVTFFNHESGRFGLPGRLLITCLLVA